MGEFKAITTQEELDRIIKDRLKREKEAFEVKLKDYEGVIEKNKDLEQKLQESMTVLEKSKSDYDGVNSKIQELNGKLSAYELKDLKTSIALKNGLSYELAGRLNGTNEEEITKDAENLSKIVGKSAPIAPLKEYGHDNSPKSKDSGYINLLKNLNLEGE